MDATYLTHYQCPLCLRKFALSEVTYTCPDCGPIGTLEMLYDYERLAKDCSPTTISAQTAPATLNMWRYRPLLPVMDDRFVSPLHVAGRR